MSYLVRPGATWGPRHLAPQQAGPPLSGRLRTLAGAGRCPCMTNENSHDTDGTSPPVFSPDTMLTQRQVAELLEKDPSTIKTWRAAGRWPNATQDATGLRTWHIPVGDLVAGGDLRASQVEQVENELAARRESRATQELRERVARLEEQLSAAQAIAEERATTISVLKNLFTAGGAA